MANFKTAVIDLSSNSMRDACRCMNRINRIVGRQINGPQTIFILPKIFIPNIDKTLNINNFGINVKPGENIGIANGFRFVLMGNEWFSEIKNIGNAAKIIRKLIRSGKTPVLNFDNPSTINLLLKNKIAAEQFKDLILVFTPISEAFKTGTIPKSIDEMNKAWENIRHLSMRFIGKQPAKRIFGYKGINRSELDQLITNFRTALSNSLGVENAKKISVVLNPAIIGESVLKDINLESYFSGMYIDPDRPYLKSGSDHLDAALFSIGFKNKYVSGDISAGTLSDLNVKDHIFAELPEFKKAAEQIRRVLFKKIERLDFDENKIIHEQELIQSLSNLPKEDLDNAINMINEIFVLLKEYNNLLQHRKIHFYPHMSGRSILRTKRIEFFDADEQARLTAEHKSSELDDIKYFSLFSLWDCPKWNRPQKVKDTKDISEKPMLYLGGMISSLVNLSSIIKDNTAATKWKEAIDLFLSNSDVNPIALKKQFLKGCDNFLIEKIWAFDLNRLNESPFKNEFTSLLSEVKIPLDKNVSDAPLQNGINLLAENTLADMGYYLHCAKMLQKGCRYPRLSGNFNEIIFNDFVNPTVDNPFLKKKVQPICLNYCGNSLLISGPNMGSKSTLARAIGIISILTRAAIPINVKEAIVPLFKKVYSVFPGEEGKFSGYSYFTSVISKLTGIIKVAKEGDLVILDEVPAGTEYKELVAITVVLIEDLIKTGANVVVTGHLKKAFEILSQKPGNMAVMTSINNKGKYDYQPVSGVAAHSHGIDIAESAGISNAIIERARYYYQTIVDKPAPMTSIEKNKVRSSKIFMRRSEDESTSNKMFVDSMGDLIKRLYPEKYFVMLNKELSSGNKYPHKNITDAIFDRDSDRPFPILEDLIRGGKDFINNIKDVIKKGGEIYKKLIKINRSKFKAAVKAKNMNDFLLNVKDLTGLIENRVRLNNSVSLKELSEELKDFLAVTEIGIKEAIETLQKNDPKKNSKRESFLAELKYFELDDILRRLDLQCGIALSTLSDKRLKKPEFVDSNNTLSYAGKPILLENAIEQKIDIEPKKPIAVITGPNGSGKSTLSINLSINVLMAKAGLYVPCNLKMSNFDNVFFLFGGKDNIEANESHFKNYMRKMAEILNEATEKTLIILDEPRGSDHFEMAALQLAILGFAKEKKCTVIANTHIRDGIKENAEKLGIKLLKTDTDFDEVIQDIILRFTISEDINLEAKSEAIKTAKKWLTEDEYKRALKILEQLNNEK